MFVDYEKVSRYFQKVLGLSANEVEAIGESKLYENAQMLYEVYKPVNDTRCDPNRLKKFFESNHEMVVLQTDGIQDFWPSTSKFLCSLNSTSFSSLIDSFMTELNFPNSLKSFNSSSSALTKLTSSFSHKLDLSSLFGLVKLSEIFTGLGSNFSTSSKLSEPHFQL